MFSRTLKAHPIAGVILFVMTVAASACGGSNPEPETGMSALPAELNDAAPVLNSMTRSVPGLSQSQAIVGTGSLLGLAKARMPADHYAEVTKAIPGSDALVNEAARQGLAGADLSGLAGVSPFLGKSGITYQQLQQMVPVLGSSVKGKVSPEAEASFVAALR